MVIAVMNWACADLKTWGYATCALLDEFNKME
jgi:hypothetical protein